MVDKENIFTASKLKNISQCDISLGKNNQLAKPKLDRWKDLNNAIIDWINNDAPDETSIKIAEQNNFQFYDKIQKSILVDLFARFRSIYPKQGAEFNHEFPTKEIYREINGEEYAITTYFTYEFIENEYSEYIKLKTSFNPEVDLIDRAIITKLKKENEDFYVASTETKALEEIELVENPDELIDDHFEILENFLNKKETKKLKRNPGSFCSMGCDMSSRCGQFPLVNVDKITNRIREVKVTKTNAIKLLQCERRAAWNVQYGIPKENYLEYESASLGTKFHDYSQSLLVNNNNFAEESSVNEFKELVEEHEDTETSEKLFQKYKELIEQLKLYKNLSLTKSEFNLGFTIVADGKGLKNGEVVDKKVATIFMGRADLAGRVDDKPLIVELKTRQEHPEDFLEAQLYALGASKLLKTDDVITLHIYISDTETKIKERSFSESELLDAEKKFLDLAKKSASWIPFNALSPKFEIGEWCQYCEFRTTCSENRISAEQQTVMSLKEIVNQEKESLKLELKIIEKNKEKIFENQKKIIELKNKEKDLRDLIDQEMIKLDTVEKLKENIRQDAEELLKKAEQDAEELLKKAQQDAEEAAKKSKEEREKVEKIRKEFKKNAQKEADREFAKAVQDAEELLKKAQQDAEEAAKKSKEEREKVEKIRKEFKKNAQKEADREFAKAVQDAEELLKKAEQDAQDQEKKAKLLENKNESLKLENTEMVLEGMAIDEANKLKEDLSKKYDDNSNQLEVYINLKNRILKNSIKQVINKAGYGSNQKLSKLDRKVYSSQFIEPITGYKPSDPYDDTRFMVKVLLKSYDLKQVAPSFEKLKNNQLHNALDKLLPELHEDAHSDKFQYTDYEVLEIGQITIDVIKSIISTNQYKDSEVDILKKYLYEAEELIRPYTKS
jgi:hypothetical protein